MKLSQWVLDVVRVRLAVRGEDQGHTKDGRKGLGVHVCVVSATSSAWLRSPILYVRVYSNQLRPLQLKRLQGDVPQKNERKNDSPAGPKKA